MPIVRGETQRGIIHFFDHPRFRGLWYFKTKGKARRWCVTYHDLDGEFVETEDHSNWQAAILEAMKSVGVRMPT